MHVLHTYEFAVALLFASAAGLLGPFALMKRMLLASDVISHLALPGLGLAFLLNFNPLLGGGATLFLGAALVWQLQRKTGLAADTTIGVVFATALAIGAAVTPKEDLVEVLFGTLGKLSLTAFVAGSAATILVIVSVLLLKNQWTLTLFSSDLAATSGVRVERAEFYFLLIFSLTVLLGLRFMGALLTSALIILPAAAGRRFTNRVSGFIAASMASSIGCVAAGFLIGSQIFKFSTAGPVIVLLTAIVFMASLLKKTA